MASIESAKVFLERHVGGKWHARINASAPAPNGDFVSPGGTLVQELDSVSGFYCDALPERTGMQLGLALTERYGASVQTLNQDGGVAIEIDLPNYLALSRDVRIKRDALAQPTGSHLATIAQSPTSTLLSRVEREIGIVDSVSRG